MRYEYGINYAGTHTMQWDFQLKRRNSYQSSPTFLCFGSPTAYLRSSIIYSAPCDRIEQKAYLQQLFCCIFYGMVCTWRHQILKSKTKKPPKVLFSSGISTKCISLHLSSLIASFVWKPTHFEFRSYVPVKSKLQHPRPRAFEFLANCCWNSPLPGRKSCSNASTLRKITRLLF